MKLITDNHYHIWTDALHARQLARQTTNRWDRGTYIRWTIITAWTALEIACQEALDDHSISYSFRRNLDDAISTKGHAKIDWGCGVWQQVGKVQELRKNIVHRFVSEDDLFPDVKRAEEAIGVIREAIADIFVRSNKPAPSWTKDDFDNGWTTGLMSMDAAMYDSTYENDPDSIKITYIYKDTECTWEVLAPGSDPEPNLKRLIENICKPISAIRVYKNQQMIKEISFSTANIRAPNP